MSGIAQRSDGTNRGDYVFASSYTTNEEDISVLFVGARSTNLKEILSNGVRYLPNPRMMEGVDRVSCVLIDGNDVRGLSMMRYDLTRPQIVADSPDFVSRHI
jgi:hypothetical protein